MTALWRIVFANHWVYKNKKYIFIHYQVSALFWRAYVARNFFPSSPPLSILISNTTRRMSSASESRGELLSWVNDLLQTNYAKVEQMGTGAALCQIVDSIYGTTPKLFSFSVSICVGDVPLSKVNFSANQEYQYVNNFKVLQTAFATHHIDKPIPVERLVKLKFQDNLVSCCPANHCI